MAATETKTRGRCPDTAYDVEPLALSLTPKRILLVRVDRIGDMLITTPALRALRRAYQDARIDLVASDLNRAVVADNPHIDQLWRLPLRRHWEWPWLLLRLRSRKYQVAVDLNTGHSRTSGMLVHYCGARDRVGFEKQRRKGVDRYYNHSVPLAPEGHHVEQQLRMARALGAGDLDPRLEFVVPENARRDVERRFGPRAGVDRVGIFVGNAKKVHSRWPIEKFTALTRALSELPNLEILILAGPSDEPLVAAFDRLRGPRCKPVVSNSLAQTAALLETCRLFVTSSSGPMHLAAAVGTATLSILAGSTYRGWRPLGAEHSAVRSSDDGVDVRSVPVDAVVKEARRLLRA